MSEFTQIEADTPVVIPSVEEKVYDTQWLSHFRINSTPEKATIIAHLVPYNGVDTLKEPIKQIVIDNVFASMQDPNRSVEHRTLFAQAMELILQAVKSEVVYLATPAPEPVNEPEPIL